MRKHNGFTLFEVTISLFLLSIILLGVNATQVKSYQQTRALFYYQQANIFVANMAEYLIVHHGDASGYLQQWHENITQILPSSSGNVAGNFPSYRISIQWGGMQAECQHNQSGVAGCVLLELKI